jgi:hypothetical protein
MAYSIAHQPALVMPREEFFQVMLISDDPSHNRCFDLAQPQGLSAYRRVFYFPMHSGYHHLWCFVTVQNSVVLQDFFGKKL